MDQMSSLVLSRMGAMRGVAPRGRTPIARAFVAIGVVCALLAAPTSAFAVPRVGSRLPEFTVDDVDGHAHTTRELRGRPTLVVAITESGGADPMTAWGHAAEARVAPSVRRVWMALLNLAFFIAPYTVRTSARGRTPRAAWVDTWIDIHGSGAEAADLPSSSVPWAFVLDASGTITASFHGAPTDPGANVIWQALQPSTEVTSSR